MPVTFEAFLCLNILSSFFVDVKTVLPFCSMYSWRKEGEDYGNHCVNVHTFFLVDYYLFSRLGFSCIQTWVFDILSPVQGDCAGGLFLCCNN